MLSGALAREGFEAFYADDKQCYLRHIATNTVATAQPNPHRPFSAAELKRRDQLTAYLDSASEDALIEEVLLPLFRQLGFHRITAAGRDEFQAWLADPGFGLELRDEGLLKLFFADLLSSEQALALVRARREVHQRWLDQLRAVDAGPPFVGGQAFPDVVLAYGIDFSEWAASWWEAMERRLLALEA